MARISGVDLPREKRIEIGLTYVYGIGRVRASKILAEAEVNPDTRVKDLTDEEVARIAKIIDADTENLVEGDLRREVAMNIKRKLAAIEESAIEKDFHAEDRRLRLMPELARVQRRQLQIRRSN